MEYRRIKGLNISENITKIRYVCNVAPYYFFSFTDPDGNIIEVTGKLVTVSVHEPDIHAPSIDVAVIVATPGLLA